MKNKLKYQIIRSFLSLLSVFLFNLPTLAALNINYGNLFTLPEDKTVIAQNNPNNLTTITGNDQEVDNTNEIDLSNPNNEDNPENASPLIPPELIEDGLEPQEDPGGLQLLPPTENNLNPPSELQLLPLPPSDFTDSTPPLPLETPSPDGINTIQPQPEPRSADNLETPTPSDDLQTSPIVQDQNINHNQAYFETSLNCSNEVTDSNNFSFNKLSLEQFKDVSK